MLPKAFILNGDKRICQIFRHFIIRNPRAVFRSIDALILQFDHRAGIVGIINFRCLIEVGFQIFDIKIVFDQIIVDIAEKNRRNSNAADGTNQKNG